MSATRRVAVDLEDTRLIFIMLKGSKPMRKVAIPITDKTSWPSFESQVMSKLRIQGIHSMSMALTGEPVTSLSQLQDIDQIYVHEGTAAATVMSSAATPSSVAPRQSAVVETRLAMNGSGEAMLPESHGATVDDTNSVKYIKKRGPFASFVRGFMSQSLLPTTTRDLEPGRKGRRKVRTTVRGFTVSLVVLFALFVLFRYMSMTEKPVATTQDNIDLRVKAPNLKQDVPRTVGKGERTLEHAHIHQLGDSEDATVRAGGHRSEPQLNRDEG